MAVLSRINIIARSLGCLRRTVALTSGALLIWPPVYAQASATTTIPSQPAADQQTTPREVASKEPQSITVGTNVYPRISETTDQPRFDPLSNLLVNTVGAKTGLFGAAAHDGLTWANRYVPGTDLTGVVQLYSLSTSGNYGAFFGARSSDNRSPQRQNVIGSISLVVADSPSPHLHWAHYSEGYVPPGKVGFRLLINNENSIQNEGIPAPSANPYDFNPQHLLNNLRLDCGIGFGKPKECTNPLSILNNGSRYRTGILFGNESIDMVDGVATAIALPLDYGILWFSGAKSPTWQLYATARKSGAGRLIMADDMISVNIGEAPDPALRVEQNAIRAPAFIASRQPPVITGNCLVRDQRGGNAAGAFALEKDCANGTIVLGFSASAPSGWACFASDVTRGTAEFRETSYNRTSATFAVLRGQSSDSIVFSCTGF